MTQETTQNGNLSEFGDAAEKFFLEQQDILSEKEKGIADADKSKIIWLFYESNPKTNQYNAMTALFCSNKEIASMILELIKEEFSPQEKLLLATKISRQALNN